VRTKWRRNPLTGLSGLQLKYALDNYNYEIKILNLSELLEEEIFARNNVNKK
jgi:hypothetical protein